MNSEAAAEPMWFKSSYSTNEGGACIEVALTGQIVRVRDSKDVTRPGLTVGLADWARFVRYASRG
ncbi:DUF397 domain-containing protein [Streptomyces sp. NPDC021212]|uniref:DUF397 domain-containing protein n=1 Tax=Streptomyces sp. NPDC021212 TaxID=3365118 RepID=UPI0037B2F10E